MALTFTVALCVTFRQGQCPPPAEHANQTNRCYQGYELKEHVLHAAFGNDVAGRSMAMRIVMTMRIIMIVRIMTVTVRRAMRIVSGIVDVIFGMVGHCCPLVRTF
jgi:ABC-type dipeptide/oligopeptide/nickel transport system permease subunit